MGYDVTTGWTTQSLKGPGVKVHFALIADTANFSTDGKLNIIGLFNTVYVPSLPATHLQMRLIVQYIIEPSDIGAARHLVIHFRDPDGAELFGIESTEPIRTSSPLGLTVPQVADIQLLRFEKYGEHTFAVEIDGVELATVPLRVAPLDERSAEA
ncbi:MAG TPA: hypothetical protein VH593_05530 [Ktedonobacteraceae bacterium]|jgi:hypothetical protein